MLTNDYSKHDREIISLKHTIDTLKLEIEQGGDMPASVKNVLKSTTLTGIHNTIGNLINVPDNYLICSDIVLGSSKNFIIVDNEISAKECINYL